MNKILSFVVLWSFIALTFSCQNDQLAGLKSKQQAAIDSIVNLKLSDVRERLIGEYDARFDSLTNAKAETALAAAALTQGVASTPKSKPKYTPPAAKNDPPPPPPQVKPKPNLEPIKPKVTGKKPSAPKKGENMGKKNSPAKKGVNRGKKKSKKKETTP